MSTRRPSSMRPVRRSARLRFMAQPHHVIIGLTGFGTSTLVMETLHAVLNEASAASVRDRPVRHAPPACAARMRSPTPRPSRS
jgi:hypothetical protein